MVYEYLGGPEHSKRVLAEWLDGGRVLKVESYFKLETQQGDHRVHLYEEYRLAPDGQRLTVYKLRSTQDQALTYMDQRTWAESAGMTTTAAGLLRAVVIDESLIPLVEKHGLKPLRDFCGQFTGQSDIQIYQWA